MKILQPWTRQQQCKDYKHWPRIPALLPGHHIPSMHLYHPISIPSMPCPWQQGREGGRYLLSVLLLIEDSSSLWLPADLNLCETCHHLSKELDLPAELSETKLMPWLIPADPSLISLAVAQVQSNSGVMELTKNYNKLSKSYESPNLSLSLILLINWNVTCASLLLLLASRSRFLSHFAL